MGQSYVCQIATAILIASCPRSYGNDVTLRCKTKFSTKFSVIRVNLDMCKMLTRRNFPTSRGRQQFLKMPAI